MGGRGAGFSGQIAGEIKKKGSETFINVGSGQINLSDNPLIYGDKDVNITDAQRTALEVFEDKYWYDKKEHSRFIDLDGNVIEDNVGTTTSVGASYSARMNAIAMSHNHPRNANDEQGQLGGTFSNKDLQNFTTYNQTTYRATTKEGTYSISKLSNFDSVGFTLYYTKEFKASQRKFNKTKKTISNEYHEAVNNAAKSLKSTVESFVMYKKR